jgi:hypothetical protein
MSHTLTPLSAYLLTLGSSRILVLVALEWTLKYTKGFVNKFCIFLMVVHIIFLTIPM